MRQARAHRGALVLYAHGDAQRCLLGLKLGPVAKRLNELDRLQVQCRARGQDFRTQVEATLGASAERQKQLVAQDAFTPLLGEALVLGKGFEVNLAGLTFLAAPAGRLADARLRFDPDQNREMWLLQSAAPSATLGAAAAAPLADRLFLLSKDRVLRVLT